MVGDDAAGTGLSAPSAQGHWRRQRLRRRGGCFGGRCRRRFRLVGGDVFTLPRGPLTCAFQLPASPIHGAPKGRAGLLCRLPERCTGAFTQARFGRGCGWGGDLWCGHRDGRCISGRLGTRRNRHGRRQALCQAGAAKPKQKDENQMIHARRSRGFPYPRHPSTSITQKGNVRMEAICSVVVIAAINFASPPMARAMT